MHFIILDLEATCWQKREYSPNEIIEIGAVCVNERKQIVDEFCAFVQPSIHPELSDFCTELTSITQDMVDDADEFPEVYDEFLDWIQSFDDDYLLCAWGFYDRKQLEQDCKLHDLPTDWLEDHISLKHQHGRIRNQKRGMGMKGALRKENIQMTGTHHRGIDDARNIAKIFIKLFDRWEY